MLIEKIINNIQRKYGLGSEEAIEICEMCVDLDQPTLDILDDIIKRYDELMNE